VLDAEGIREEVLRWLSDGAVVHSSWWGSANGRSFLCYAAFGRLLTQLQHLDDDRPAGEQPEALDEDRAALRGLTDDPDLDYVVWMPATGCWSSSTVRRCGVPELGHGH
jgi:hypothetical protein